MDGPVFLTGFMATGKSKIGGLLAERMHRCFVDTDEMIEERAGVSIAEIFAAEGEEHFRDLEHECVVEAAARGQVVVALGGGAVTQQRNRDAIRAGGGALVCLEADVDTILKRVGRKQTRPLLAGLNEEQKKEKIERMLAERAPYYAAADIAVRSSEGRTAENLAAELYDTLHYWVPCTPSS